MQYTIKQNQVIPLGTHRGWIPKTEWPELEALREAQRQHLATDHASESSLLRHYDQVKADHLAALRADPSKYGGKAPQLVPTENELANARAEEEAWINRLVDIVDQVKATVERHGQKWQASLGNVEGLFELSQRTAAVQQFVRGAHARFPEIVKEESMYDVIGWCVHVAQEARHKQLLYNWIERTMTQDAHLGFAYGDLAREAALPNADQYLEGWAA